MKEIRLTKGAIALVDDEDYERIAKHRWCMSCGYALRGTTVAGHTVQRLMHREILRLPSDDKRLIDHRDGNRLNNQKSNLRICNKSENSRNRLAPKNNKTGFKGVCLCKATGRYRATINVSGSKQIHLGYFDTAAAAHEAYSKAAPNFHGEFANNGLNQCLSAPGLAKGDKVEA
ncbi:HNH endonuclease [Caballeronia sp. LZ001]|uniref:HNH endonuclease n=1 Tax=Caballeronia sp. LZ001 TaxID=3038553 RepID=UPI00285C22E4|nr:AP2 domain-containing protein [Caballeronia sp. LZ001]MDR5802169.1 AP2 domain-containing protein [Caballeronia sp. LZ001]